MKIISLNYVKYASNLDKYQDENGVYLNCKLLLSRLNEKQF